MSRILLPVCALIGCLCGVSWHYSQNILWKDDWEIVPFLSGKTSIGAKHDAHRPVAIRSLYWLLWKLGLWNPRIAVLFGIILTGITGVIILKKLGAIVRQGSSPALLASVMGLMLAILYSPAQWINWVWGWDVCWPIVQVVATSLLLVLVPSIRGHRCLILIILFGSIASFSLLNGILLAPIGYFLWRRVHRPAFKPVEVAFIVTVLVSTTWMILGSERADLRPAKSMVLFLRLLGGFVGFPSYTLVAGMLECVAILFILWRYHRLGAVDRLRLDPYLALLLFTVMSAAVVAIGRGESVAERNGSSRYVTMSAVAPVLIVALLFAMRSTRTAKSDLLRIVGSAAIVGLLVVKVLPSAVSNLDIFRANQRTYSECMNVSRPSDSCLMMGYPDAIRGRELLGQFDRLAGNKPFVNRP